jgi:hypothetical protein
VFGYFGTYYKYRKHIFIELMMDVLFLELMKEYVTILSLTNEVEVVGGGGGWEGVGVGEKVGVRGLEISTIL